MLLLRATQSRKPLRVVLCVVSPNHKPQLNKPTNNQKTGNPSIFEDPHQSATKGKSKKINLAQPAARKLPNGF